VGVARPRLDAELVASGSRMTVMSWYRSTTSAPSATRRSTSSAMLVDARRSRWTRLGAAFGSRPPRNQTFGPPHPAASTKARSGVESSSTSEPSAAAQNRATRRASTQSKVRFLTNDGMLPPAVRYPPAAAGRSVAGRHAGPGSRRPAAGPASASPACTSSTRTGSSASTSGSTSPPSCASSACSTPDPATYRGRRAQKRACAPSPSGTRSSVTTDRPACSIQAR
jgi:hypothetical protein